VSTQSATLQQVLINANGSFTVTAIPQLAGAQLLAVSSTNIYGLTNGIVRSFGTNSSGQLGRGNFLDSDVAVAVSGVRDMTRVVAAGRHAFSLTASGEVWGWGADSAGHVSGLAPGGVTVPKRVAQNFGSVRSVHAGQRASFAVLTDGRVIAWGDNSVGGLGDGGVLATGVPVLSRVSQVQSIAVSPSRAIALKVDGTVTTLQLARAGTDPVVETTVPGLVNITAVFAAHFSEIYYAIDRNGQVFVWGENRHGGFANGSKSEATAPPVAITTLPGPVDTLSTSGTHTLARLRDGRVFAWGQNASGQLGDGTTSERLTPVAIPLTNVTQVAAGVSHSLARRADGSVMSWGEANFTGLNRGQNTLVPTRIDSLADIDAVAAGYWASAALRRDGVVFVFGESRPGSSEATLGDGSFAIRRTPVLARQVDGGGRVDTNDWYLDLDPGLTLPITANFTPKLTSDMVGRGSATSFTASANVATSAADATRTVGLFVLGRVPQGFLAQVGAALSPGMKVVAQPKNESDLILVQLTPSGWQVVTGPLTALTSNVQAGNATANNILRNINLGAIPGARFCVGYGTDAGAMLQAGTLDEVLTLPGVASSVGGLPCVLSGTYLSGPATARVGATVRFNASVIGLQPTGTVQLLRNGQAVGAPANVIPNAAAPAVATLAIETNALPVGEHAMSAQYSGDGMSNLASNSQALTHRVTAVPTVTVALTGPSRIVAGNEARLSIQAAGDAPTGRIEIRDSGAVLASAALQDGVAGVSLNALAVGARSLTAHYLGDARNVPAASSPLAIVVEPVAGPTLAPTAIALTLGVSAATARVGDGVVFTIQLTGAMASTATLLIDGVPVPAIALENGRGTYTFVPGAAGQVSALVRVDQGGTSLQSSTTTLQVTPVFSSTTDTDGDGVNDALESTLGLNIWLRDNDVFANTDMGRRLFVMQQYRDFLGREGDDAGVAFWVNEITAGRQTRTSMADSFFSSPEFQNALAPIARLYFATYERIPDYAGLLFWSGELARGRTLTDIGNTFASAPEFTARYGQLSNRDYVDRLYRNVLGRPADAAGLDFWSTQLGQGTARGAMLAQFSESAEYRSRVASSVFVNAMYVAFLRRGPDIGGFDFWSGEINRGRRGADLVDVFLTSSEYRARFLNPS
jgi:alpha-tubulin suppressor-like RCC1 family protein